MKNTISKLKEIFSFLYKDDKFFLLNLVPCTILFVWSIYKLDIVLFCMSCYLSYMNLHNLDLKFKQAENTRNKELIDLLSERLDLISQRTDNTQKSLNTLSKSILKIMEGVINERS